ncbi:MAG: Seryl-tRNA synthetase, partial [Gemmatimonadetes bacterium]|nr:Seryl-tRNA synthetase [Gemmatimonadota bacterium]
MHDARLIRERLGELREAMDRRGALGALAAQLDRAEALEQERRRILQVVEEKKATRNASSGEVARRKKAGEDASDLIAKGRTLGEE